MIDLTCHFTSLASAASLAPSPGRDAMAPRSAPGCAPSALWQQVPGREGQPGSHRALVASQTDAAIPVPWMFGRRLGNLLFLIPTQSIFP